MPRRPRPSETSRSEHWLRVAVNQHQARLNQLIFTKFGWPESDELTWLSPVKSDSYAEYYDASFLRLLGLDLKRPLETFWPRNGPRWDGLAKSSEGRVLLVEAKAYIEEGVDFCSSASTTPLAQIQKSLAEAKRAFKAHADSTWDQPYYQYTNRLAHLHFLNGLNGVDAYLLFLYFADAPDVPDPSSTAEWKGAERLIRKCLGLGRNPYQHRVGTVVWSVSEMTGINAIV